MTIEEHTHAAATHISLAKSAAAGCAACGEAGLDEVGSAFQTMAAAHTAAAEHHLACCQSMKAAPDTMGKVATATLDEKDLEKFLHIGED